MGAVLGRALVAPRWTSQQEPVVGNWSRLSASAGDTGAPPGPPGRDSWRQGGHGGEDERSLRELRWGQVGWGSCRHVSPPPFLLGPVPFLTLGLALACVLVNSVPLFFMCSCFKFTARTSCSLSLCSFFSTALYSRALFRLARLHRVPNFPSCAHWGPPPTFTGAFPREKTPCAL